MLLFFIMPEPSTVFLVVYQYICIRILQLNQAGPGWEVPMYVMVNIGQLGIISIILICGILVLAWTLRKRLFVDNGLINLLLLFQFVLCIVFTIVLWAANGYHGQFYYPNVLVPGVFYCMYVGAAIMPTVTIIYCWKQIKQKR